MAEPVTEKATRAVEGQRRGWRGQLVMGRRVVWTCGGHDVHPASYQARQCANAERRRREARP